MLPWSSICIPRQIMPSPMYPALQAHENEPTVLRHAALMSHAGDSLAHSSKSEKKINKIKIFKNYVPQKTCPHPSLDKIPPWLGAQVKIWLGLDDAKVINTTKVHPR